MSNFYFSLSYAIFYSLSKILIKFLTETLQIKYKSGKIDITKAYSNKNLVKTAFIKILLYYINIQIPI